MRIIVIGGGAAGFFGAIRAAESFPDAEITILEKSSRLLSKVKISGGGRCNVTNSCFDVARLVKNYPRGEKELYSVFKRFGPADTFQWFRERGVELKTESDGRVFPVTDNSETIINCFLNEARERNINISLNSAVKTISKKENGFLIELADGNITECDKILAASGGSPSPESYSRIKELGHNIIQPVPSLFTFNYDNESDEERSLTQLPGISVENANVSIVGTKLSCSGPLLITHWGFSGPAILKLSAFGARILKEFNYEFVLRINWTGDFNYEEMSMKLEEIKHQNLNQVLFARSYFGLPLRLWKKILSILEIHELTKWTETSKSRINSLANELTRGEYKIKGKSVFKEEFVTCGGVSLKDVNFKTMESRKCPGLFFAGEILDVDGITGGFNFQSAWSTGYVAGSNIAIVNEQ